MGISKIRPFYIINSARSSFHSLFHIAPSLPCRCHGSLSFQVFRFNSLGLIQRDYLSLPASHLPKFIISIPCLIIRLTFHVNQGTFPWSRLCGSAIMPRPTEQPLQEKPSGCVTVYLPWFRVGLPESCMIQMSSSHWIRLV